MLIYGGVARTNFKYLGLLQRNRGNRIIVL